MIITPSHAMTQAAGRTVLALALLSLSGLASCSGPEGGGRTRAPRGSPDPQACRDDSSCVVGFAFAEDEPCCTGARRGYYNRRFERWMSRWRFEECSAVECPTVLPLQEPLCAESARCRSGRCTSSCED